MNARLGTPLVLAMAALCAGSFIFLGCEEAVRSNCIGAIFFEGGTGEEDQVARASMSGETLLLIAIDREKTSEQVTDCTNGLSLFLPLRWSVSDGSLGSVISATGFYAVYKSTGKVGENIVTVRDQGLISGTFIVDHFPGVNVLEVKPELTTLAVAGDVVVLTATTVGVDSGLVALPLSWSVKDDSKGNIISSEGRTAVYKRYHPSGSNVITVRDSEGNEGLAVVNQS